LETFALPEVLKLVAETHKSGELSVVTPAGPGRIWFEDGLVAAFDAYGAHEPFEAFFEIMRQPGGSFSFEAGAQAPEELRASASAPVEVAGAVEAAEEALSEWREIEALLPSPAHRVSLAATLPDESMLIERRHWEVVAQIGSGCSCAEAVAGLGRGKFGGYRALREMVEMGLVSVAEPTEARSEPAPTLEPAGSTDHSFAGSVVNEPASSQNGFDYVPGEVHSGYLGRAVMEALLAEVSAEVDTQTEVDPQDRDEIAVPADSLASRWLRAEPEADQETYADHEPEPASQWGHLGAVEQADQKEPHDEEAVDGLADRGPWTAGELASFEAYDEAEPLDNEAAEVHQDDPEPSEVVAQDADHEGAEEGEPEEGSASSPVDSAEEEMSEEQESEKADESPVNRSLLLKFLSSVRS